MNLISDMLSDIRIPKMAKVRQSFYTFRLEGYAEELQKQLLLNAKSTQLSGKRIAVAVGSRKIYGIGELVRILIDFLKSEGALPFIVPAMGHHGGACAEGQLEILSGLGITPESMGVSIAAGIDVIKTGPCHDGSQAAFSMAAAEADGIVLINRVKPHPNFSGEHESGLLNMLATGLGNLQGASDMHNRPLAGFSERILKISETLLEKMPVLFGVAVLENAVNEIAELHIVPKVHMATQDAALLRRAKAMIPRVLFDGVDVMIIDRIGKDICGNGFDPNVTGKPQYIVMLDMTEESEGAAQGIGEGAVITRRLFEKIDLQKTYLNIIVTNHPYYAKIPMIMDNERLAVQAAIKMLLEADRENLRIVRIQDTLNVEDIWISEAMLDEAERNENIEVLRYPGEMEFSAEF